MSSHPISVALVPTQLSIRLMPCARAILQADDAPVLAQLPQGAAPVVAAVVVDQDDLGGTLMQVVAAPLPEDVALILEQGQHREAGALGRTAGFGRLLHPEACRWPHSGGLCDSEASWRARCRADPDLGTWAGCGLAY